MSLYVEPNVKGTDTCVSKHVISETKSIQK